MELGDLKNLVIKYLSYRPRSVAEVTTYLHGKTSDESLIKETLDFLQKYKLIDDEAFAKWLVESRSRSRPRGSRLLKQELKQKGISPELISTSVPTGSESDLALKALQPKLSRWSALPNKEFRIKAGRFLSSRGFSWPAIEDSLKKAYHPESDF